MIQLALFRERVTWPHAWTQGRYYHVSTRKGRHIGKLSDDVLVVRFKGNNLIVPSKTVRLEGKQTALTEAELGRGGSTCQG